MKAIGERIKELRTKRRFSQEKLGDLAGMSKAGIGRLENGHSKSPTPDNLFGIAKALGVDPQWLATGIEPKTINSDLEKVINLLDEEQTRTLLSVASGLLASKNNK